MAQRRWARTRRPMGDGPSEPEKQAIGQACDRFIKDVLKPRFLPEIRPTQFNYPVDIFGKWHGRRYRFIQRFRGDRPGNEPAFEFDRPFARIEYVGPDRFDLAYFRHTGQWWTLLRGISLAEALSILETDGIFHPIS